MYNNDSNSLNAGAPDIRLSGNQDPNQQMASYGYDDAMGESRQAYDAARQKGVIPIDMEFEEFLDLMREGGFLEGRAPQQNQRMASAVGDESDEISMGLFGKPVKDLTPPELQELQEEIDRLQKKFMAQGGRAGIMAAAPGTYSQRRKQMMAYGGIAGADGRKKYGIGSFFQDIKDKFVDDIIPNEIKNPAALATIAGLGLNQFGLPDVLTQKMGMGSDVGQNWLGDLLGGRDAVLGPGGSGDKLIDFGAMFGNPQTSPTIPGITGPINPHADTAPVMRQQGITDMLNSMRQKESGLTGLIDAGRNFLFGDTTRDGQQPFNWKIPVAAGIAAGKYTAGQPRDTLPMDQTGINFQTAQEAMDDPNLRFKPKLEDTQLAAEGGRIGYADAGDVDPEYNGWKNIYEKNPGVAEMHDNHQKYLERYESENKAEGGRIGYADGTPNVPEEFLEDLQRRDLYKFLDKYRRFQDDYKRRKDLAPTQEAASGGRIGADEGGLMNLGGMEKDYRNEGGFVPIGGKEKADDVPARLSKNEFVFTADAVRGAGGGDIDQGAEIMENMMKHLEAGGEVSEDSQGLEGARGMFANAQELQKRII